MNKPEDISQEAWDASDVEFNWTSKSKDGDIIEALRVQIARAIIMATLAEREACAVIADEFELENDGDEAEFFNKNSGANWDAGFDAGCTLVGRSIRRRGEP